MRKLRILRIYLLGILTGVMLCLAIRTASAADASASAQMPIRVQIIRMVTLDETEQACRDGNAFACNELSAAAGDPTHRLHDEYIRQYIQATTDGYTAQQSPNVTIGVYE